MQTGTLEIRVREIISRTRNHTQYEQENNSAYQFLDTLKPKHAVLDLEDSSPAMLEHVLTWSSNTQRGISTEIWTLRQNHITNPFLGKIKLMSFGEVRSHYTKHCYVNEERYNTWNYN